MDGMGGMAGAPPPHDHLAHAPHDKMHAAVERLPDGSYRYPHGAFLGHVVPGSFFMVWGAWWALTTFARYLSCLERKQPFRTHGWQRLPVGPSRLRGAPLEPLVKLVLPLVGILGELWLGHDSYRNLYAADGKFELNNLNDWQHSTMYASFMASGLVDLLGHAAGLPPGTELAFLALSFLSEGLLLVFHLKGPRVEVLVHLILALQVFSTVVGILAELARPSSILAAAVRPWLTMLQGVWWVQAAYIMYTAAPQWDPDTVAAPMVVPVPFVAWAVGIALGMLGVLLVMRAVAQRRLGRPLPWHAAGGFWDAGRHSHARLPAAEEPEEDGFRIAHGGDVELSGLVLKTYA